MNPLQPLVEDPKEAAGSLPEPLRRLYGGGLHLAPDAVYANFVTSLDGVAALSAPGGGPAALSGRSEADRLVMALLRARADAVVIGASTMREDPGHLWTPAYIHPASAAALAEIGPEPELVVVSSGGEIDPGERALAGRALILTSPQGRSRLRGRVSSGVELVDLGPPPFAAAAMVEALRARGHRRILTEGGPHLLASLLRERVLDELFLTFSPVLAGRDPGEIRQGLIEGVRLLPEAGIWAGLKSLRRQGSHLFLRYDLRPPTEPR
ncbi:MAG TPA: dihydrofolate reductase family protein [Candidatus Nitrosotalea sp.]|nr:dihydrofolate reductase family protein [Candidatus Nitrosotalea sp.]